MNEHLITKKTALKDHQVSTPQKGLYENHLLRKLITLFQHSPNQINYPLESDAELIRLEDDRILAITLDHIVEEIETGLYADAYLIGWMTVMVNMSDLAAVGARPIGILLAQQFSDKIPEDELLEMQRGVADACNACNTYVLGGDTNFSEHMQSGGTAIGMINEGGTISRKGCKEGDILFTTGKLGQGSAFAFTKLFKSKHHTPIFFQPRAKLNEGEIIRRYGSSCIDTSDGFLAALSNLMELNKKGFQVDYPISKFVHQDAINISLTNDLPSWIFLAGPHGEFELLFTIPENNLLEFLKETVSINWHPLRLGKVTQSDKLLFSSKDQFIEVNPFKIVNLYQESGGQAEILLRQLLKFHSKCQLK